MSEWHVLFENLLSLGIILKEKNHVTDEEGKRRSAVYISLGKVKQQV